MNKYILMKMRAYLKVVYKLRPTATWTTLDRSALQALT